MTVVRVFRPVRSVAFLLGALLLTACASANPGTAARVPDAAGVLSTLAPGDPVAQVELAVLSVGDDPETVDMGALGGPAVINFWATWCSFCVDEMPDFEAVHQAVGDQVRFIGVDREDFVDRALTFAADIGITYELLEDPLGEFFALSKGRGMPTTLFVDADGIIRYRHAGPMTAEQLRTFLQDHLDIEAA